MRRAIWAAALAVLPMTSPLSAKETAVDAMPGTRLAQAAPRAPAAAPTGPSTAQAQPAAPAAGTPAPPPPQPVRTEILNHDNWTVTCREFADKKRTCSAVLQVVQQQNNQVLFVWIIGRNGENKLMSVLQTPTGVAIAPGAEVKFARGAARKAVFANCESSRCEATLDMDDATIRDATASENVEVTVVSTAGQSVKFTLPFKGFDKAISALR